jgi:hypothetical protein
LLLKLAELDANAESAVRVIAFFDALAEQHANLDQVLRSAAALAGCRVGIRSARLPGGVRVGAEGGPVPAGPRSWACPVASGGEVWLERAGGLLPQDEMLLERLAIACASLTGTGFPALAGRDDPELVELVISSEAGVAERSRALSLLGFTARSAVQVAYVTGPFAGLLDGLQSRPNLVRHAVLGGGTVLLVAGTVPRTVAADLGACVGVGLAGPALDAPASWQGAQQAVRFAAPVQGWCSLADFEPPAVVWWADLGPLALLASRITTIRSLPGSRRRKNRWASRWAPEPGGPVSRWPSRCAGFAIAALMSRSHVPTRASPDRARLRPKSRRMDSAVRARRVPRFLSRCGGSADVRL